MCITLCRCQTRSRAPAPLRGLTCVSGCWSRASPPSGAPSAAGGCWSTGRGRWRWWPSGWSPAPARTRWNSGWRKYCALPAMENKEINKKAKAPLMKRSAQLDCNRLSVVSCQPQPANPEYFWRGQWMKKSIELHTWSSFIPKLNLFFLLHCVCVHYLSGESQTPWGSRIKTSLWTLSSHCSCHFHLKGTHHAKFTL